MDLYDSGKEIDYSDVILLKWRYKFSVDKLTGWFKV